MTTYEIMENASNIVNFRVGLVETGTEHLVDYPLAANDVQQRVIETHPREETQLSNVENAGDSVA